MSDRDRRAVRGRRGPRGRLGSWALAGAATGLVVSGVAAALLRNRDVPRVGEWVRADAFQLRRVDFVGLEALRAGPLCAETGVAGGVALVDVDPEAVAAAVRGHPRVAAAHAVRVPPDRLVVGVRERTPLARDAETGQVIDRTGVRFPLAERERDGLPALRGALEPALPLLDAAAELGIALAWVDARTADDLSFGPEASPVRVRIGRDARGALLDWLELVASGVITQFGAREVDLRFAHSAVLRDLERGEEDGAS